MQILVVEGFDEYNGIGLNTGIQATWPLNSTGGVAMAAGRFGGQAASFGSGSPRFGTRTMPSASASVSAGFAFKVTTIGSGNAFFWLLSSGTYMIGLSIGADGSISAGRYTALNTFTVLGTSAAGTITLGAFQYIEIEATISDTIGTFNVYVDGVSVLALTNVDTRNGTPTTVNQVQIGSGSIQIAALFDDLYVTDTATRLGECRVEPLVPTSDAAVAFVPSTGASNFALVDEATVNGDTDYVSGSTVGDSDLYGLGDLSDTPTTIHAVVVSAFAEKTDAASRSIGLQAKSGATTSVSGNLAVNAAYGKYEYILQNDPNGAVAWTGAAVNAMQAGMKVAA